MALKKKITKEDFDKLPEHFKNEYKADGDNFVLDVDGEEDNGALKRALQREKESSATSKARLAEVEAELESLSSSDARKRGDIATLEKSWQKKVDETKNQYEARIAKLTNHTTKNLVDNVALQIAQKISTAPSLLLPHIKARLSADFEGDEPTTRVLDSAGKVSAQTLDELANEFVANKEFSAIITASRATGGAGGNANRQGGGAPNNENQTQKPADLSKMNPTQLAQYVDSVKESQAQT